MALPPARAEPPAGYHLVWHDEFDRLDLGGPGSGSSWVPYFLRWGVRHLAANQDQAIKMADAEVTANGHVVADVLSRAGIGSRQSGILDQIEDGVLRMRAFRLPTDLAADFWGFRYIGAMVSAENGYAQRYGYWEVRLRLDNVSKGQHFAAWLLPTDGAWPPEIDLLEAVGQHPGRMFMNAHGQPDQRPITRVSMDGANSDWITVGFLWTPTQMRWTINGATVREQANFIHDRALYFLMSWEIGDKWAGPPGPTTVWPAQVSVDYVRIYSPKHSASAPVSP